VPCTNYVLLVTIFDSTPLQYNCNSGGAWKNIPSNKQVCEFTPNTLVDCEIRARRESNSNGNKDSEIARDSETTCNSKFFLNLHHNIKPFEQKKTNKCTLFILHFSFIFHKLNYQRFNYYIYKYKFCLHVLLVFCKTAIRFSFLLSIVINNTITRHAKIEK